MFHNLLGSKVFPVWENAKFKSSSNASWQARFHSPRHIISPILSVLNVCKIIETQGFCTAFDFRTRHSVSFYPDEGKPQQSG